MLVFKYEISRVSTGLLFRAFGGRWKCTAHLDQDVFLFKPLHAIKAFPLAFFQYQDAGLPEVVPKRAGEGHQSHIHSAFCPPKGRVCVCQCVLAQPFGGVPFRVCVWVPFSGVNTLSENAAHSTKIIKSSGIKHRYF